ncbi:FkbM family methyltransferase [Chloroflexota bacterium]
MIHGAYEPHFTPHITQVARQCSAPRILDVGAHYGWYTVYLAKLIAGRGTVFAFEPNEAIFSLLQRNVELNDLHNVRLYRLPLSDKRETITMVPSRFIPKESRYMHSVTEQGALDDYTGTLGAIPFDELNEMEAIHPNIVKIDVHGAWRKVLDGMRRSLQKEVEHLYLELDTTSVDLSSHCADIEHVILMLRDAGMDVYEIQGHGQRGSGKMTEAAENQIARIRYRQAWLYAVRRRGE